MTEAVVTLHRAVNSELSVEEIGVIMNDDELVLDRAMDESVRFGRGPDADG